MTITVQRRIGGAVQINVSAGVSGLSAYELAVKNGFSGTEQDWLASLQGATDPNDILLPPELSALLGGAETLADALLWLAQNGGTPSPILRDLIGGVVISSASSAAGSLTVGSASSIALVGTAVSTSALTGAMSVVMQIALTGAASGSSSVAGSLTVEAGAPALSYLPSIPNALKEVYSPFKVVSAYSGPTLAVCATAAADTPASSIDVYPDPTTGNPDFGPAIAAYGSAFDIYKLYSQTGSGNDAVTTVAGKRFAMIGANAWGALQPVSARSSGSYALIPDTLVTSRQDVSLVSVTAQRAMYNSSQIMGLANTNNIATYLNMLSDYAGVQALGNVYKNGEWLGLVTPTIKAICSGAANVKIHRNDNVNTWQPLTASASMLGGAIGAIKSGAGASVTGQSAFEDHFFHAVYTGMVSDADMVTLKAFLKTRFEIVTAGKTWQMICFGDSIMWGQAAFGGRGYPSKLLPYLPSNVEVSNPSTPGRSLSNMITDWNAQLAARVEASKAKRFVLCNGGTNDIGFGSTAATTLGRVQTLAAAITSKGAVPVFLTIPARDDTQWSPAKEAEKVTFNAGLLDPANQASWGIKVIDRAANPDLQNASNTTFFHADKLHLLEAGYQSAAAYEQAALNAIMAA